MENCDLLIIGGGINGVGIAADAAGRDLKVILCEEDDLASGTSSASSKLIHGGLRYLEQFDFRLVREALSEREVLLKRAPHLVQPLEFVLPHSQLLRSPWMIRCGLFLYDHLAKRSILPASKKINFTQGTINPLKAEYKIGFSYYDAKTDDARLVVANAQAAQQKAAKIWTQTKFITANRQVDDWLVELFDLQKNTKILVKTKVIVNAAGPWIADINQNIVKHKIVPRLKLVKGSHIIVPKLHEGSQAYLLQNQDKRVTFVIPYQNEFSLIGTTDVVFSNDPRTVNISAEEINYLCQAVNNYFNKPISAQDVVSSYAGIRALYNTSSEAPAKISREYHFEIDEENNLPLLTIVGGKLTTYRALAEHVLEKLEKYFPMMGKPWTMNAFLPGGDLAGQTISQFAARLKQEYPFLTETLIQRYVSSYGNLAYQILRNVRSTQDLGKNFGAELFEVEINYLKNHEWAKTSEDILWRRTKLGLFLTKQQQEALGLYVY